MMGRGVWDPEPSAQMRTRQARRVEGVGLQRRGTDSRPAPRHRVDEPVPGVRMALPPRLQDVAQQEQPGQAKTVLQVLV